MSRWHRLLLATTVVVLFPLMFTATAPPATLLAAADTTPPVITPTLVGTKGSNGWYTSAVNVSWTVTDAESAIASTSGCAPTTVTGDTVATALACTATNSAGLAATATVTLKIDKTAPVVTAEPTSKPASKGWYTQPVTVSFLGIDAISGIASCTPPVSYSGPDTKNASVAGSCTNVAGLSATATTSFKYDASPPLVNSVVSGTQGANGWYTSNVTVGWTLADPQSDIDSSSGCAATTLTADTPGTTLTCSATNGAGLTTQASVTVKIDRAAPDTTITGGPNGTVTVNTASFSFSASEAGARFECSLDGGAFAPCSSPQSYGGLTDGDHSFAVRAVDAAGNVDPSPATQSWKAHAAPPTLRLPAAPIVEAVGPSGTPVTYVVSADDAGQPLRPDAIACAPPSGSTFPLGSNTVTCKATNSYGVSATGSFVVKVVDTIPPRLTVPAALRLSVPTDAGLSSADPTITRFLGRARASDLVDAHPTVTANTPPILPIGTTTVTFTARDTSGNTSTATSSITLDVDSPSSSPTPPPVASLPTVPDSTPPGDVRLVQAKAGDRSVTLSWKPPLDANWHQVEVVRASLTPGAAETNVYNGRDTQFVDRGLQNGEPYRYVLVVVDKAGNRSGGVAVVATPKAELLRAPADGARLRKPPLLVWAAMPSTGYYNVQLWRNNVKILSAWPAKAKFALRGRWTYAGNRYVLGPGEYRWYVWPGVGARADVNYGPLMGAHLFTITRGR